MTISQKTLTHRLARIEGQLRALRHSIETTEDIDCGNVLIQIKTATNGLRSFAETFARTYAKHCLLEKKNRPHVENEIDSIISSAFNLS